MKIRAQHVHLTIAVGAGLGAVAALLFAKLLVASFLVAGGIVALIQWKSVKAGIVDL